MLGEPPTHTYTHARTFICTYTQLLPCCQPGTFSIINNLIQEINGLNE